MKLFSLFDLCNKDAFKSSNTVLNSYSLFLVALIFELCILTIFINMVLKSTLMWFQY